MENNIPDSITLQAQKSSEKAHQTSIANKLIDSLLALEQKPETSYRRWIWELMQNAKDVACNEKVKIKIEIRPDSLHFRHTGKPFKTDDLVFLIEQTSSKDRKQQDENENILIPSNTGKFGTGFITTHLLSKNVKVKGVWEGIINTKITYRRFELSLNRDADRQDEMIKNVKESSKIFKELDKEKDLPDFKPGKHYDTTFIYQLNNEKAKKIISEGIEDLEMSGLLTMLFNPEIYSIKVLNKINKAKLEFQHSKSHDFGNMTEETFVLKKGEETIEKIYLSRKNEFSHVAIELLFDQDKTLIARKPAKAPVLFVDFPLIGSEKFPFPFYINSHQFLCDEARSSLLLRGELKEVDLNKILMKSVLKQSKVMIKTISKKKDIYEKHLLALCKIPPGSDVDWYKKTIQMPLRDLLLKSAIIENIKGEYINLTDCHIPKTDISVVMSLHNLAKPIFGDSLIKDNKEYIEEWLKLFDDDWENDFQHNIYFTFDHLINFIDSKKIKELLKFNFKDEYEIYDWLNKTYEFLYGTVSHNLCEKILNSNNLIPNQNGTLKKMNELIEDDDVPDSLKDILSSMGCDIREKMLNKNISLPFQERYDTDEAVKNIEKLFEENKLELDLLLYASLNILSIFPLRAQCEPQFYRRRNRFYDWMKIAYTSSENLIQEITEIPIEKHNYRLWQMAERYIISEIINHVALKTYLMELSEEYQLEMSDFIFWLNDFYEFLTDYYTKEQLIDMKIFPNQKNIFKSAEELQLDEIYFEEIEYEESKENGEGMNKFSNDDFFEKLKKIYKSLKKESIKSVLLKKGIRLMKFQLFNKKITLRSLTQSMQKMLQDRRAELPQNPTLRQIVKDFYKLIKTLDEPRRMEYFEWFENNVHSLMTETINDPIKKDIILDIAFSENFDSQFIKKFLNNQLDETDFERLKTLNNIRSTQSNLHDLSVSGIDVSLFGSDEPSFDQIQNEMVNFGITSPDQFSLFRNINHIRLPLDFRPSEEAYHYVLRIIERAKDDIFKHLQNKNEYDFTSAQFDQSSPNKNILIGVIKNGKNINIIIRPSDGKKICVFSEREVYEMENPNNELWCSDGQIPPFQVTIGTIVKGNEIKWIKLK